MEYIYTKLREIDSVGRMPPQPLVPQTRGRQEMRFLRSDSANLYF